MSNKTMRIASRVSAAIHAALVIYESPLGIGDIEIDNLAIDTAEKIGSDLDDAT